MSRSPVGTVCGCRREAGTSASLSPDAVCHSSTDKILISKFSLKQKKKKKTAINPSDLADAKENIYSV